VGTIETLEQRLKRKYARFPQPIRLFLSFLDFLWTGLVPKIPGLNNTYITVHGRERQVMSQYELLGRLFFCGFYIVALKNIGQDLVFIVKKVGLPKKDKGPSYGPVFRQKRVGLEGTLFHVYKFRTMYSYSEYLHKYMQEGQKLNSLGKIRDDPRITVWGRIMRRYWIDELPMIINLLRGDLKLVGVRPISPYFLNLYPDDLKIERIKHKPGLFPAFYADRPEMIEQIWEAEWNYLRKYNEHPWKTDFCYFFGILYNIILKNVRSN
jgi:lipopolysaccharide/colanic/teichoic acid biosynthesis glycosyltransferase